NGRRATGLRSHLFHENAHRWSRAGRLPADYVPKHRGRIRGDGKMRDRCRRTFCLPWFDRDDYPAIRDAFVNGARMPATYDAWLAMAERVAAQIREQGGAVERVMLE